MIQRYINFLSFEFINIKSEITDFNVFVKGGGLTCAFGIVAALLEREKSGKGQVVDVSMVTNLESNYFTFYNATGSGLARVCHNPTSFIHVC